MYRLEKHIRFWGMRFEVRDEDGTPIYRLDGPGGSFGRRLSMVDRAGRPVASLRRKVPSWVPKFEIHRDGRLFATIQEEPTWFRRKFTLDAPPPNDYVVIADAFGRRFEVQRGGRPVATVAKRLLRLADVYDVEVAPGEDDVAIFATAVAVSTVLHDD